MDLLRLLLIVCVFLGYFSVQASDSNFYKKKAISIKKKYIKLKKKYRKLKLEKDFDNEVEGDFKKNLSGVRIKLGFDFEFYKYKHNNETNRTREGEGFLNLLYGFQLSENLSFLIGLGHSVFAKKESLESTKEQSFSFISSGLHFSNGKIHLIGLFHHAFDEKFSGYDFEISTDDYSLIELGLLFSLSRKQNFAIGPSFLLNPKFDMNVKNKDGIELKTEIEGFSVLFSLFFLY